MSVESLTLAANAVQTAQDYVRLPGYHELSEQRSGGRVREYLDEESFWRDAFNVAESGRELGKVVLRKFLLSDWVPRVPGLYWKTESVQLRAQADGHIMQPSSGEFGADAPTYLPSGKTLQILGGVGNVRLSPTISGQVFCASSSGEYWRGIPVLIQSEAWNSLGEIPTGRKADVTGVWTAMPRDVSAGLGGGAGIPRYCLVVKSPRDINVSAKSAPGYGSSWTLFERRDPQTSLVTYDFAYSVFAVGPKQTNAGWNGSFSDVGDASRFLQDYVSYFKGRMLTDFDERLPRFDAFLPISELMSREVDPVKLRSFVERVKKNALSPETVRYNHLPQVLMANFDLEDLRLLAFDYLGLSLQDLIGATAGKADAVDALISFCEQEERLADLVTGVVKERKSLVELLAT